MDQLGSLVVHTVGQLMQLLGVVAVVLYHVGQQRQRLLGGVVDMLMIVLVAMIVVMGVGMGMGGAVGMGVL